MNRFTSQQRKLAYLGGILLLLIPIITLGLPSDGSEGSGGSVARLRERFELGESDLGDLDPSGAAMNLVLLGLRGVAANILWIQAEDQKNHKDWEQMRATTEQIIRLQPHYAKVWEYNGWNLAFNVSAEWDAVPDRYFWVKEGGKFLQKGVGRNRRSSDLHWHVGRVYGPKIGLSDEARFFRRYFRQDPDPKFNGNPDPDFNDRNEDNYLVAKNWFNDANEVERQGNRQTIMDRTIFRSYPARSQLDYAAALQKYGFDEEYDRTVGTRKVSEAERDEIQTRIRNQLREQTREAWDLGFKDWTQKYGQELYPIDYLGTMVQIRLEMSEDEIRDLAKTPDKISAFKSAVNQYQNMTNYRYWRSRALCEAEPDTAEAHWLLFAAGEEYYRSNETKARDLAFQAMQLFDKVLTKYPDLREEDAFIEVSVTAILIWQFAHKLAVEKPPEEFPLKDIWDARPAHQIEEIQRRLERRYQPQQ
jgi:hypothetical protein